MIQCSFEKRRYLRKDVQEALGYLDYCAHEGEDVDIEGMTGKEIVELYDNMSERGELAYDAWKERFI